MSGLQALFGSSLLLLSISSSACIGLRTPLDESSTTTYASFDCGSAADARDAMAIGDGFADSSATCGSTTTIDTRNVRADILILLDRSDSMNWSLTSAEDCIGGRTHCLSRMDAMKPVLTSLVSENPDINWGLTLFPYPDEPMCAVANAPQVVISSDATAAIQAQLAGLTIGSSTPTAAAIDVATRYLTTVHDDRNKAILLATDGLPTCGNEQGENMEQMMTDAVNAAIFARKAGFPVYVVGIGMEEANLNRLAQAGGTSGYYPAGSTSALIAAMKSIAKEVSRTCTFRTHAIPVRKDLVSVLVDGRPVARDDNDGWMFDPVDGTGATIVLTGSYCQGISADAIAEVRIVLGCPED